MAETNQYLKMVSHPLRLRHLKVKSLQPLSPYFTKVTLGGDDLKDFISLSPDDHIKAFFADPATGVFTLPSLSEKGIEWPEGQPPSVMRDYTPIKFDAESLTLDLIFYRHKQGAAITWLNQAQVGSDFYFAGPRGSAVLSYSFDWYLFITDEAGLPSLSRRLRELPTSAPVFIFAEVESPEHSFEFELPSENHTIHWIYRKGRELPGTSKLLLDALSQFPFPEGEYFSWVKTESLAALQIKNYLVKNQKAHPDWIKASGYWKK